MAGVHQLFHLGELAGEHVGGVGPSAAADLVGCRVDEHRAQRRGDDVLVAFGNAGQHVAGEVHPASLPAGALQRLARRGLQAFVGVGDHQAHTGQPAAAQRAQELGPERLLLRVADGDTEDLPVAAGGDPGGDHDRAGHDLMEVGVAGFDVGGVQVHVGELDVAECAVAERVDPTSSLAQIRDTCDFEIPESIPSAATRSSTERVETPST